MGFHDKYTTLDLKAKDAVGEKDKIVLSNDSYAICEFLEVLTNMRRD
jgi:hypothetical protein